MTYKLKMATGKVFQCSLLQCKDSQIPESASRIEACTVLPSKVTKAERDKFVIGWSRRGEAVFHSHCWQSVIKSVRARNLKNMTVKFKSAAEKLMVKEAAKTAERHDSKEDVEREAERIAKMLTSANHCVAFTGAGISTSAGIGDYRGKSGKWTENERATVSVSMDDSPDVKRSKYTSQSDTEDDLDDGDQNGVHYDDLRPTYTHEALCKLMKLGFVKYIISQNCDGLHLLSGIPSDKISELHGNVFKEKCDTCAMVYNRQSYVCSDEASQYYEQMQDAGHASVGRPSYARQCDMCGLCHYTGRKCEQKDCKGMLCDTIINFSDDLDEDVLNRATEHAKLSDLMICLGSTMTVTPACHLVEMGKQPLRLVICNRQKTALDDICLERDPESREPRGSRVFGDCDLLMGAVMRCILSADDLKVWEHNRENRMKSYDKQRKSE